MMIVEKSAKTIEEAVKLALVELNLTENEVDIEVLEQPSKGFLGVIGGKMAKVKVSKKTVAAVDSSVKKAVRETGFKPVSHEAKKAAEFQGSTSTYEDRKIPATMDDKEVAHKFIREMLDAMGIKAEIRSKVSDEGLYINLTGSKMGLIIGRRGQTLDSLQYLVSLVVNKSKPKNSHVKVVVDTEDYRQKREETLERLAKRLADKVNRSGQYVELEPMNPYERRIIHATLQNYKGIVTYSEGEEPNRKVIIDISKD